MIFIEYTKTIIKEIMGLEGAFGLASFGKGLLVRDFARFSGNFTKSPFTGSLKSLHHFMPVTPHFSSGMPAVSAAVMPHHYNSTLLPMYEIMHQQQEFQRQQQEFQKQQLTLNEEQAGMIKQMLSNFDHSFRSMMDVMSKMVSVSIPVSPPPRDELTPANDSMYFQADAYADNVVSIKGKQ